MLLEAVGAAVAPGSGGRQMTSFWCAPKLNIVGTSAVVGAHLGQAVGCAQVDRILGAPSDEITVVSCGEGATNEGEFWEAINGACLEKLPVLFLVQDNGYAISTPVWAQLAGGNIARLSEGVPNLLVRSVDGTDFIQSYNGLKEAIFWCRDGRGPALVHAHVVRPYSHSLSDEERMYKTCKERSSEASRDPVSRFELALIRNGVANQSSIEEIENRVETEIRDATSQILDEASPQVLKSSSLFSRSAAVQNKM